MKYFDRILFFLALIHVTTLLSCDMASGRKKSCDKIDTEQLEIEIVLFEPYTSSKNPGFPDDIKNMIVPLNCLCDNLKNIALNPIVVSRKDLSLKSSHDYLKDHPGNKAKILMVELAFKKYFEGRVVYDSLFSLRKGNDNNFEHYLEKARDKSKIFIYSTEEEFQTNFSKVYTSTSEIVTAMSELICKGEIGKITIVIAPKEHYPHPNDLEEIFRQITDLNISPDERLQLIPNYLNQLFASNSTIEEFGENGTRFPAKSTEEYLRSIAMSLSIDKIEVISAKKTPEGKYWTVQIIEHHKLNK